MRHADPFVDTLQKWIEVSMHRSIRNFIHYARETGLSMSQLGAMAHIRCSGTAGVTELGDHLGVTSAAASKRARVAALRSSLTPRRLDSRATPAQSRLRTAALSRGHLCASAPAPRL